MKVGRLAGPGRLVVEESAAPRAGPGEIVVTLAACGVCGTDLEKLRGRYRTAGRIGHEPVGRIEQVGDGVAQLTVGERVFVHHHVPCYACEVCARGDTTFCAEYARTNIDPGGFAESFRVPRENVERGAVLALDPSIDWDRGALFEPAGCAVTALRRVGFTPGNRLFVTGLGPVGVLYARVARALGASWVGGAEISPARRERAARHGFDLVVDPADADQALRAVGTSTGGKLADVGVAATGAPAAIGLAYRATRRGGTLNLFGLPEPTSRLDIDLQEMYLSGVRVVPTYATTEADVATVQRLALAGTLDLSDIVTHRRPVAELGEAFDLARDAETSLKVLVTGPAYAG
ncbi:MAG: alcohol dehydrogenase catalytic domain-containing protein [Thermoplasmata archaeon]|nr:alcohol dehydrogenase catalytic domain-containing protein [Thermoplasmata archaeon]